MNDIETNIFLTLLAIFAPIAGIALIIRDEVRERRRLDDMARKVREKL
mgnify:FL=1